MTSSGAARGKEAVAVFHRKRGTVALLWFDLACGLSKLMSLIAWWARAECLEIAKQKQADCCEERPLALS